MDGRVVSDTGGGDEDENGAADEGAGGAAFADEGLEAARK